MFKRWIWLLIFFLAFPINVLAEEDEKEYINEQKEMAIDYDEIQNTIDELSVKNKNNQQIDFRQMTDEIISGDYNFSVMEILEWSFKAIFQEVFLNTDLMVQIIVITIIIAIFTNFTSAFNSKYIGEVGFFVTYLILSAILIKTFQLVGEISETTINNALVFIQALVPSFFATVSLSGNFTSTLMFHETTLLLIGIINYLILKIILPLINLIVILEIANNITEESILSKLTEIFKGAVSWILKTILVLFFGLNLLQSLTMPMVDTVTNKSIKNVMQVVPVVGSAMDGVTDTVLGSTVLIKNAVGVGGVIILITICLIPLLKIIAFILIYYGVAAIIQPISNKRVVDCLSGIGDSTKLLLGAVFTVALLFIISIAIVTISTNLTFAAR
ncbi:MAG: stage III sporulation protein AE [Eubacteriales bacterium]